MDDGVTKPSFAAARSKSREGAEMSFPLIPWQGAVAGVRTENLKWPLQNEILYPEKSRGVSNEMTGDIASIEIKSGLLLVVHRRNS